MGDVKIQGKHNNSKVSARLSSLREKDQKQIRNRNKNNETTLGNMTLGCKQCKRRQLRSEADPSPLGIRVSKDSSIRFWAFTPSYP